MRIATKHFGFYSGRDWSDYGRPRRWYRRLVKIGWGAREPAEEWRPYRRCIYLSFWLIPNFLWYREVIRQEPDLVQFQDRIIGIQSWPFSVGFARDDQ